MNYYKTLNLKNFISIFLGMYLFGFLINGLTFIKYIGLYGAMIFFIIYFTTNKSDVIESYKKSILENKFLLILLLFVVFSILVSIVFAYSNYKPSLKEFRITFLNMSIFMIIILGINNRNLMKLIFYSIIAAFTYDILSFSFQYIQNNPNLNLSIRLDRHFSDYFEILYPFIFIVFFILKNRYIKISISAFLLIGFFDLILTGARGAWVTVLAETILLTIFISLIEKKYIKKIISFLIFILSLSTIFFIYLYNNSTLIQTKLKQGISPNGRSKEVKTRLPVFLKHGNFLVGIGGPGNYQYNKFLNDYNAPKIGGAKEGNRFRYWSDEPFLLQIFYKEGLLGLSTFLSLSFYLMWLSFKILLSKNNLSIKLFISALIISFIGEYFIRGIVEGRSFKYLVFYSALFIIFTCPKENNENSLFLS